MSTQTPAASIAHSIPGRLRLKIEDKRGDPAYFDRAERVLARSSAVVAAVGSPLTGSLLVQYNGPMGAVLDHAQTEGLFSLTHDTKSQMGPFARMDAEIKRLDEKLRRATNAKWGTAGLAFYGLIAASAVQLSKGKVMPPALSLILSSFDLYIRAREAERAASSGG